MYTIQGLIENSVRVCVSVSVYVCVFVTVKKPIHFHSTQETIDSTSPVDPHQLPPFPERGGPELQGEVNTFWYRCLDETDPFDKCIIKRWPWMFFFFFYEKFF